jgi:peroxiredoxin Q/BCP
MTEHKELKIGVKAPAFKLPDAEGNTVSLADYKGKWFVLYFYPKDSTSGCTTEAVDFTGSLPDFRSKNAEVVGVSPDSCKSHQKFIVKHSLMVTLLSDEEKTVLEKYGVWQLKKMYGKDYYGVVRTTFLIDPEGKIRHIWNNVKVNGHIDEVKNRLKELQG